MILNHEVNNSTTSPFVNNNTIYLSMMHLHNFFMNKSTVHEMTKNITLIISVIKLSYCH